MFDDKSEKELVEKAKTDPDAFGQLFDKYYDAIYRYVLHRTGNADLTDDITADTFHKALEKLWRFKWMNVPFSAWLYRIATNEVNGYYRKTKQYRESDIDNESESNYAVDDNTEQKLNSSELFEHLRLAVEKLDSKYQEVITFRYFEELSLKEICEITGKAEGTVKSLIHRGLKLLENEIDENIYKEFRDE